MSTALQVPKVEDLTFSITDAIHVNATPAATFEALLVELGPSMGGGEDKPMPMKIEAWPGGRWFRDLGEGNGHLWAHVQAIKRNTLLEFSGPLMMSYAVANNVQYRLKEAPGGTLIEFHHYGLGAIPAEFGKNMEEGWRQIHQRIKQRAEKSGK